MLRTALTLVALGAMAQAALPEAFGGHVVHESRLAAASAASRWRRVGRVEAEAIVPVRIGLKQSNLEAGEERLVAASHPGSKDYGKHLTAEEVHDLFAPSEEAVEAVRDWLVGAGVDSRIVAHSDNKGWLAADVPAEHAERLFHTELYEYEHASTGDLRIGCDSYRLPGHLRK